MATPKTAVIAALVLQRLAAACRAQEAPASPHRVVRRSHFQQRIGEFEPNSASKLGERIHLACLAHIHGIPGMPDWADWADELATHRASIPALGIGCTPLLIKGEKEQFLNWLSWGVESEAIRIPASTGSIRWPRFNLESLFLPPK